MDLLVLFCLAFGVSMLSAETQPEIVKDLMPLAPLPPDNPFHLAKQDLIGEEKPKTSSWPEIPFLERFLSSLFPSYTKPYHRTFHKTTTQMPLIIWRFRFYQLWNNSNDLLADATKSPSDSGSQDLMQKIGTTSSSPVSTEKISKSSRRKRNKEDKAVKLAKRLSLHSYINVDGLDNYNTEGKNLHKKLKSKNDKNVISINDISHNFNKSSNSTYYKNCYRRLYTYVTTDWRALFIHILVVLVFILVLTVILVTCQALISIMQVQRAKITPTKFGKSKAFQVYSMV